eukprot:gb/GEZN01002964.1/.p1 GENE.gb/GEZN01002964.1/~~gb/GEZN01002964.1/.p1  ORF type:complete len:510 (+),score=46.79 gb/GEZN01002964.1/:316-1845(+)
MAARRNNTENVRMLAFVPTIFVWGILAATLTHQQLWPQVLEFWPASVAMLLGSVIAGATPLGGGIVVFPMAILLFDFSGSEARDTTILVQVVGMSCAAYLLCLQQEKRELLSPNLIITTCIGSLIGICLALWVPLDTLYLEVLYTMAVVSFTLSYMYVNMLIPDLPTTGTDSYLIMDETETMDEEARAQQRLQQLGEESENRIRVVIITITCLIFAVVGGALTAQIGTGSDIALYIHGVFVANPLVPLGEAPRSPTSLTANAVVVMAFASVFTALLRLLNGPAFASDVLYCWASMAFVVCVGTPLGSTLLTTQSEQILRICFYVLALVQFVLFGILKIKGNVHIWIAVSVMVLLECAVLFLYYWRTAGMMIMTEWNERLQKLYDMSVVSYSFSQVESHKLNNNLSPNASVPNIWDNENNEIQPHAANSPPEEILSAASPGGHFGSVDHVNNSENNNNNAGTSFQLRNSLGGRPESLSGVGAKATDHKNRRSSGRDLASEPLLAGSGWER